MFFIYIYTNFVFSSSTAVPGWSVSCSWSDSDSVFWRGAPWSQQCQRQTDHRAGKTYQVETKVTLRETHHIRSFVSAIKRCHFLSPLPMADQCGELPAAAGCSEHATLPALLQQHKPGDVWLSGPWPDGPHLPGLVQLQRPPEASLLQGQRAHHCVNFGQ